ncbi:unnamed protein product [Allacma fusca]|uniref:Uncharacterized protein n=1 Tax=Allacma fusca TaxID=39272 RepID=A0A8J2M973_9HEXA|nr:unnamed protein product [Allacma fusca]
MAKTKQFIESPIKAFRLYSSLGVKSRFVLICKIRTQICLIREDEIAKEPQRLFPFGKDRGFADRVVTSAVKTGLQIKMRVCNRLWNKNDLAGLDSFGHNLVSFLQHVVWFSEGHQRYDREFLLDGLKTIEETVKSLIRNHFSQHALGELEEVLIVLQNPKCLDAAFTQGSPENKYMKNIGMTIKSALISGGLMKQEETVTVGK